MLAVGVSKRELECLLDRQQSHINCDAGAQLGYAELFLRSRECFFVAAFVLDIYVPALTP